MHQTPPPPGSSQTSNLIRREYRKARPVPLQVLHNASICIRERLFSNALSLLSAVLISGTGTTLPAAVPSAQYLALASTLIVHPWETSGTNSVAKHAAADDALRYLRHVITTVGPVEAGLSKAFVFAEKEDVTRTKRKETRRSGILVVEDMDEEPELAGKMVKKQSLWRNVGDFWDIVGWAFNCSVVHPHRWARWKVWLELMCDILESDLNERAAMANDMWVEDEEKASALLRDSLLAQYLSGLSGGRGSKRRIVGAILADGKQKSMAEFKEIWDNETALPKTKLTHEEEKAKEKKRKLDLEQGDYGDYFDHDDSASEKDSPSSHGLKRSTRLSSAKRRRTGDASGDEGSHASHSPAPTSASDSPPTKQQTSIATFGGISALHLRRRLLRLLALYTTLLPSDTSPAFFTDTETLIEIYVESLRDLPLPIFSYFALPIPIPSSTSPFSATSLTASDPAGGALGAPWLEAEALSSLLQVLVRPLLSGQAPVYHLNALTPGDWIEYFAPWPANVISVAENARVSLGVEGLGRLLKRMDPRSFEGAKGLKEVVEKGIRARRKKAGLAVDGKKKEVRRRKGDEEGAVKVLEGSERRLRALVGLF